MDPAYSDDGSAATEEPIRVELVPAPPREFDNFLWPNKKNPTPPPLVLDMGIDDAIRLTDPNTKALIASAGLGQVTAKPAIHRYGDENNPSYPQPLLIVDVPGVQPLRIGAQPAGSGFRSVPLFRYGWRGSVRSAKETTYVVTEAEWLTLIEKFGLSSRLVDELASGEMERRDQRSRVKSYAFVALTLVLVAVALYMHFTR